MKTQGRCRLLTMAVGVLAVLAGLPLVVEADQQVTRRDGHVDFLNYADVTHGYDTTVTQNTAGSNTYTVRSTTFTPPDNYSFVPFPAPHDNTQVDVTNDPDCELIYRTETPGTSIQVTVVFLGRAAGLFPFAADGNLTPGANGYYGQGGSSSRWTVAETGAAAIEILDAPQYLYARAQAAFPVKFRVIGLGTQVNIDSIVVKMTINGQALPNYPDCTQRFSAASIADGGGSSQEGNGTTDTYVVWVPASLYQNVSLPSGWSTNTTFQLIVGATGNGESLEILSNPKGKGTLKRFYDKTVNCVEMGQPAKFSFRDVGTKQTNLFRSGDTPTPQHISANSGCWYYNTTPQQQEQGGGTKCGQAGALFPHPWTTCMYINNGWGGVHMKDRFALPLEQLLDNYQGADNCVGMTIDLKEAHYNDCTAQHDWTHKGIAAYFGVSYAWRGSFPQRAHPDCIPDSEPGMDYSQLSSPLTTVVLPNGGWNIVIGSENVTLNNTPSLDNSKIAAACVKFMIGANPTGATQWFMMLGSLVDIGAALSQYDGSIATAQACVSGGWTKCTTPGVEGVLEGANSNQPQINWTSTVKNASGTYNGAASLNATLDCTVGWVWVANIGFNTSVTLQPNNTFSDARSVATAEYCLTNEQFGDNDSAQVNGF